MGVTGYDNENTISRRLSTEAILEWIEKCELKTEIANLNLFFMRFGCKEKWKARETDQPTGGGRMFWEGHFGTENFLF